MTGIDHTDPNPHTGAARASSPAILAAALVSGVIAFATLGAVLFGETPPPALGVALAGPVAHPIQPSAVVVVAPRLPGLP
jgi:hypothetical protein